MLRGGFLSPLAVFSLLCSGCNGCPRTEHPPQLSTSAVRGLSDAALASRGIDLGLLRPPTAQFEIGSHNCTWYVEYRSVEPNPAITSGFVVLVNDLTKYVEVYDNKPN